MFLDKRVVLALFAMTALAVPGCSGSAEPGADDGEHVESVSSLVTATSSEYQLPAAIDTDVLGSRKTEIWARVYRPATLVANKRYPLLVFLHGNHTTCGTGSNPRVDDSVQYSLTGTCPASYVVAPSHNGYGYFADDLAANGYIVVSINANRGINALSGGAGDRNLILARGRLILKHLALLSEWDRGVSATPASIGADLKDHLDFSQVGLLGHSRGGEGIRAAYNLYKDTGSLWPARIVTPVNFAGMFEIGPTDGYTSRNLDMADTRWAVILPMCDGDVKGLLGVKPFDRLQAYTTESRPGFKSTLTVWGTNHNYYNTEWQQSDSTGCVGTGNTAIFSSLPGVSGSPSQQLLGKAFATTFFRANVGTARTPSLNALFDPKNALPSSITSVTRVDRGFLLTPDSGETKLLEDFGYASGFSHFGQSNDLKNVTVTHQRLPEHDIDLHGGLVSWLALSASPRYYQINFAASGSNISLAGYDTLDIRVDRADNLVNPSSPTDFTVQLVDVNDALSLPRSISDFVTLSGPAGSADEGVHSMLQTARIPLVSFLAPLDKIRGVRFTFDATASGAIYLAHIRATKIGAKGAGMTLVAPTRDVGSVDPTTASAAPAAPLRWSAPSIRARAMATTMAEGRVVSFGSAMARKPAITVDPADPAETDIEVASSTPFPVMDDALVLHVGGVEGYFSHYPDPNDLRRVVFTMGPEERRLLRGGEEMTVTCGHTQWSLGRLQRAHLAR
jgi:hypothetical protein